MTLGEMRNKFGVFLSFQNPDEEALREQCEILGKTLICRDKTDVDWRDVAMEIQNLPNQKRHDSTGAAHFHPSISAERAVP